MVPLIVADIYEAAGALRDIGETIAQSVGQTQARWQVLSAASAEPRSVPQIARRLGVSRQAVQRLANLLVAEDVATFEDNPDHKGSPHLVLTDTGRATLARLTRAARGFHETLAADLRSESLSNLHSGLRMLTAALRPLKRDPFSSQGD
jgi:DNA-binding MarR family transcriptional regulator